MSDLISREAALKEILFRCNQEIAKYRTMHRALGNVGRAAYDGVLNVPAVEVPEITGDTSDGYHTFNELYHHRAVLFSVIVRAFPDKAWKARQHHDGSMFDGMFIVGIDAPDGQATYHYDIAPYWDMFDCRELERAPEWDGHTPSEAIERIGKLEPVVHGRWIPSWEPLDLSDIYFRCSVCRTDFNVGTEINMEMTNYCPNCGAKMDGDV